MSNKSTKIPAHFIEQKNNSLNISTPDAKMTAFRSLSYSDRDTFFASIFRNSIVNEDVLNDVLSFCDDEFESIGFLSSIFVNEDCRGKGVGSTLIGEFLQFTHKTNCDILVVFTDPPKSSKLISLYARHGFDIVITDKINGVAVMANKGVASLIFNAMNRSGMASY